MFTATKSPKREAKRTSGVPAKACQMESLEDRVLMSTWYVSNSGSNSAAGTINAPLLTLKAAVADAKAGDTITLRAGSYKGGVTIKRPNITVKSYAGEKAYITADWRDASVQTNITFGMDASGGKLLRLDIAGGNYYAVKLNSNWDSGDANIRGASNILIQGGAIHDSGDHAVKITPACNNVTINRVEIYNPGHVSPDRGMAVDSVQANHLTIKNSYFHDGMSNGIYSKGGAVGVVFKNNRLNNFRYSGILLGQSSDENWIDTNRNPNYYENINGTVRNNVITNVGGAGIGAWAALRPVIENNTIINAGQQGMFSGLLIQAQEHWPVAGPLAGQNVFIPSTDVTMRNNIVVMDPSSTRPALSIRTNGLTGSLNLSNNLYYQAGKKVTISDEVSGYSGGLAGWKALGYDQGSSQADPNQSSAMTAGRGSLL